MNNCIVENIRDVVVNEGLKNNRVSEASLAKKLGLCRTSVREALKHLEADNLIERRQGTGISLKMPSVKELIEIYDIRILLEGLAVRYLTENLDGTVLNSLRKAGEHFNRVKKSKDEKKLIMADTEFHRIIINNCPAIYLVKIIDNLHLLTLSFKVCNDIPAAPSYKKVVYPHEKVIETMATGNSVRAEEIMRLHIEEGKNNLVNFLLGPGIKLYRQEEKYIKGGEYFSKAKRITNSKYGSIEKKAKKGGKGNGQEK